MSTDKNNMIDTAKAFYGDVLSDPAAAAAQYLADDFLLENYLPENIPFGGRYEGGDGLAQYLTELSQAIEMGPLDMQAWTGDGTEVVVRGGEQSLVKSTGKTYSMRFVHWLSFNQDGKLTNMREYNDTAEMAEAFTP